MKTKTKSESEQVSGVATTGQVISLHRVKEIMTEEEIDYTEEEFSEVLQFISKIVAITTCHYERTNLNKNEGKLIAINTNCTHETKSLPLHPCEHRRAS